MSDIPKRRRGRPRKDPSDLRQMLHVRVAGQTVRIIQAEAEASNKTEGEAIDDLVARGANKPTAIEEKALPTTT